MRTKRSRAVDGMTQEQIVREAVMTTEAGRRWRARYLRDLGARRLRESAIARGEAEASRCSACDEVHDMGSPGTCGRMIDAGKRGGVGYERDAAKAHDVPERSFVSDVKRKLKIRKVMQDQETDGARGEISALLDSETTTLGGGRQDGMSNKNTAYEDGCAECGEAHATTAHAAVARKQAKEAIRAFDVEFHGEELVRLHEQRWGTSGDKVGDDDNLSLATDSWRQEQNYRRATDPSVSCSTCRHYDESLSTCLKFESFVRPGDLCDAFEARPGEDSIERDDEQED